jgi:hypothetical protein
MAAKKSSTKKVVTTKKAKAKGTVRVSGPKSATLPSRVAARRFIKGIYNAAVRAKQIKGKRASCMMNVPESFRSKFKIDGVVAGQA